MTPSPPDEVIHFRGKTLTPESPRPLHPPEPANIPLLQNQMDPAFDDTAAYENPQSGEDNAQSDDSIPAYGSFPGLVNGRDAAGGSGQEPGSFHSGSQQVDGSMIRNETLLSSAKNAFPSDLSSPAVTESSVARDAAAPSLTALASDPAALLDKALSENPSQQQPQQAPPVAPDAATTALPLNAPTASEVDPAAPPSSKEQPASHDAHDDDNDGLDTERRGDAASSGGEDGVDFQNLLDHLSPSASTAPSGPAVTTTTTTTSPADESAPPPATTDRSLPTHTGLPPRPPPQEKPAIHPNYTPSDDIRSYHQFPQQSNPSYASQQSNYPPSSGLPPLVSAPGAPGTASGANGLPPPPVASFQQPQPSAGKPQEASTQPSQKNNKSDRHSGRPDEDTPWGPDVQKKYDEFLQDERVYVTEGNWDRFPPGSRLFVGNLPTERVTKRDLFHVFHKYGKLAQISIKQAYGFVQFLDANACYQALQGEQGGVVRGRKIHLEISKPQRNSRQAQPPPEPPRPPPSRRSRSPEYRGGSGGRNSRPQGDRYDRAYDSGRPPFSDFRDEPPRRRDDYRPPRSPSPRGFRGRDEYRSRDRTPERYDRRDRERRRSRSPYGRDRRYRSPSPRGRSGYDSDSDLPIPRRVPRDVPDVQVIVLDDVDRNFIYHIENSFQSRGLRVDVLMLSPRISLSAVVRRQIIEGVLAVVKLSRSHQYSGKIPLQVFDRSGGVDNVRFNEYSELDLNVAAEIVLHTQNVQRSGSTSAFPPNPPFTAAQFPQGQPQQPAVPQLANPNSLASLISSLDGPTLQSLLAALQQRQQQQQQPAVQAPQQQFPAAGTGNATDLATLLSNATRQQNPVQPIQTNPQQPLPGQQFNVPMQGAPMVPDPNLMSLLAKGLGGQPPQGQASVVPQVQNIVNQLAKWKQ